MIKDTQEALELLEKVYDTIRYDKGKDYGDALNKAMDIILEELPHLKDKYD